MKFSSLEEFDLQVHRCFAKIFELLTKIEAVVMEKADEEERHGEYGAMSDARDWIEDVMLYCHLAWQYHRLSKGPGKVNTWETISKIPDEDSPSVDEESSSE
jgi:hypothetical protein